MSRTPSYLIVGASVAGGRAAETLRQQGFNGRVILVGWEPDRPYERPPLSKDFLQGTHPEEKLYLQPTEYYAEHGIELRLGVRATDLDPARRTVALDDGTAIAYDKLLIATGTQVRKLSIPGSDLAGVHYLRTLREAATISSAMQRAQRVVVIGAGFIGLEVAATARAMGKEVTVLEAAPVPLVRALGEEMGRVCAAIHRDNGVDLRLGCGVQELRGSAGVTQVIAADGAAIPCDMVIVGVGVTAVTDWLDGSGIEQDNGVMVNEYGEASLPDIYAAGDVANWWHPTLGERLRIEHYDNAQNHGIAVGKVMAGVREPYAPVPYFWSDQYGLTLQYVGHARGDDRLAIRGDVAQRSFTAFYVRDEHVKAAFSIGRPRDVMAARRLIGAQKTVDVRLLADEQTDLKALSR